MKGFIGIFIFIVISLYSESQTIDPYLISCTGNSIANPNYSLDYSLGEILIETLSDTSHFCTQGILQPNYQTVNRIEELSNIQVKVYPNPTTDIITISTTSPLNVNFQIINLLGEIILQDNSKNISVRDFPNGIYYLRIFNSKNELIHTHTIVKS
jgi:hypothetical protein